MRKAILFIPLMTMLLAGRTQVNLTYMHCLEVTDNGDVSLVWHKPVDEDAFVSYTIFYSTTSSPFDFQPLPMITFYGDTNYLHSPTAADEQQVYYYILTDQNGALPDIISDTLSTIHLTVDNSDPYLAVLNWNAVHNPSLPGTSSYYRVYMHDSQGAFSLVDSTQDTHFEIPVAVCSEVLSFRVENPNQNSCASVSNSYSALFEDITPPPMPSIDSVSIDPFTGELIIGWDESPAEDAGGYVVYQVLPNKNDTLDFVFGSDITSYFDASFDPCAENRSYALSAFDTCGNISPGSYDYPHRSILLEEVEFDPCLMSNMLRWTEYINMVPALEGYRIYRSTDNGPFELLDTRAAGTLEYEHDGLEAGRSYRYFVRAFSQGDVVTSSSCMRELTTWQYRQPQENSLENISVENSEYIALDMLPDTFAYVPSVQVFRAVQASGPFELITEIEPQGQAVVYYDDLEAAVDERSYWYKTSLIDSCGNEVLESNTMRSIYLSGEKAGNMQNELDWNAFEGWPGGVDRYELYRARDEGAYELILETAPAELNFTDDISSLPTDFTRLHYVVLAFDGNDPGLSSRSNEILFEYSPRLFLPTAFTPGGANPVYKPVGTFANFTEYRLDVFNRWGELIFSSREFGTGWDGSIDGDPAPAGVYVCLLSFRSENGSDQQLRSTFILLR